MLKAISGWDGLDWDAWTLECTPSMSVAPPMMHVVSIKFSVYSADSSKTLLKLVSLSYSGWDMAWTPSVHARLGTREMWRLRLLFVCSDPCMTLVWLNRTLQTFSS